MPRYLTAREIREKFEVAFSTHQTDALTEVMSAIEVERVAEMAEIRESLTTLVEVTTRLAQAQARTEQRVEQLTQAQVRTDETVKALAQAQMRTETRVEELAQAQKELAQAQARTEQVVAETRVDILQMREQLARMDARIVDLQQAVGSLGNELGFDLEEYTSLLLPPYLERHFGIKVSGLTREHFRMDDGNRSEVDLVGHATREGQEILVLGDRERG